jgi:hypothetical protein
MPLRVAFAMLSARTLLLVVALAGLAGCHIQWLREHPLGCRLHEQPMIRETLYFGASIPAGGMVDAAAWDRFSADVLTSAFPSGYTVLDGHGAWRNAQGGVDEEPSRLVIFVHADDAVSNTAVADVIARHRASFRQESVLRERSAVCGKF